MASERTKQCKRRKIIFTILHFLALFGPFLYFIPFGFATAAIASKICLGFSVVVALILGAIALITDLKHRGGLHKSMMWILIGGLLFCLDSVAPFIGIMAGVSIIDELILVRAKDHYTTALIANKEIDRRE